MLCYPSSTRYANFPLPNSGNIFIFIWFIINWINLFIFYISAELPETYLPDYMLSSCHVQVLDWIYTLSFLPECQGTPCSKQTPNLEFKWQQFDSGIETQSHLNCKLILSHLAKMAKWLSVCLQIKWLWVRILLLVLFSIVL